MSIDGGIRSTLGVCLGTMSQELFTEGTRSTRIVALDIGGKQHSKEREQIQDWIE